MIQMAEKVNVVEEGFNSKIMEFILKKGSPQRYTDILNGVGLPEKKTGTATHKALIRMTARKFLSKDIDGRYYISKSFANSVRDAYNLLLKARFWG